MRRFVMKRILAVMSFVQAFGLPGTSVLCARENAPFFSLPQMESGTQVSLDDFRGQIVVLDFFNANCGDCVRVSWEL